MQALETIVAMWRNEIAPWAVDLGKDGVQGVAYGPIARFPLTASHLSMSTCSSDDYQLRKCSVEILGHQSESPHADILNRLLDAERRRDAASTAAEDYYGRLTYQSVVESIVFTATRWCRQPTLKSAGLLVLRRVVKLAMSGEYWNTSAYAMSGLAFHGEASDELIADYAAWARTAEVDHPSRPTLVQERSFAEGLQHGWPNVVQSIEVLHAKQDEAVLSARLSSDSKEFLRAVVRAAEQAEAVLRATPKSEM